MVESDLSDGVRLFLKQTCLCDKTYGEVYDIDMVGVNNSLIYAVEMKTTLSTKVLQQAKDRKDYANFVYIAIPYDSVRNLKYSRIDEVKRLWLDYHGIGLITILQSNDWLQYDIVKHGKFNRYPKYKNNLIRALEKCVEGGDGGLQ